MMIKSVYILLKINLHDFYTFCHYHIFLSLVLSKFLEPNRKWTVMFVAVLSSSANHIFLESIANEMITTYSRHHVLSNKQ